MKILIVDSKNKRERIDINANGYVKDIVETLKVKMGINNDIILHYNGEILEENQSIQDLELEEESVLVFMGKFRGGEIF